MKGSRFQSTKLVVTHNVSYKPKTLILLLLRVFLTYISTGALLFHPNCFINPDQLALNLSDLLIIGKCPLSMVSTFSAFKFCIVLSCISIPPASFDSFMYKVFSGKL